MLKKTKENFWILEKFEKEVGVVHGFSGRKLGNMSPRVGNDAWENIEKFLSRLGLNLKNLVLMGQSHQNKVLLVKKNDKGKVLKDTDGMVTREKRLVLGIKVADCLPVIFYDPQEKIIGVAHAGWKGVRMRVAEKVVEKMKSLGSYSSDILVGIGPHIGPCCYTVLPERARVFKNEFGSLPQMVYEKDKILHLDLAVPPVDQLAKEGVKRKNIEIAANCTSCQNDEFFSFRKEGRINGEMLGVISLKG